MALVTCPECGRDISDKATTCIHCGYPLSEMSTERRERINVSHSANVYQSTQQATSTNFVLFSADKEYVNIMCKKCGKVYKYNRTLYFDFVTTEYCIPNSSIQCPNCQNSTTAYSKINASWSFSFEQSSPPPTTPATSTQQSRSKGSGCLVLIVIIAVLGLFSLLGGGGSNGNRTCPWCNGTGYNGNGATNVTEYVFKKTRCTHCDGTGTY